MKPHSQFRVRGSSSIRTIVNRFHLARREFSVRILSNNAGQFQILLGFGLNDNGSILLPRLNPKLSHIPRSPQIAAATLNRIAPVLR